MKKIKIILISSLILALGLASHLAPADHTTTSATLAASTTAGNYPLNVDFQVAVSPSSDAGCAADSYTLDFGDGSIAMGDSTGPGNVSHTYMTPGIYTAQLDYSMEADHGGFSVVCAPGAARSQVNINVMIAQALIPEFVVTQIPGPLPVEVRFSALSSTTDPVCAPISRFEWDFGDGSPTGMGSFVAHNYEQEGSFDVSLSLRDDCGREVSSSMTVEISGEDGETGGSEDEGTNGEEENGGSEDEEIELSPQQIQVNRGAQTIGILYIELKNLITSTTALVRNMLINGEDLSDVAYQVIEERINAALVFVSLIEMEMEPLEMLEEAQGTVFLEHLRILGELLLNDNTGISLNVDSAHESARDRDLERVQFELEDAIFKFTVGLITFEDWSDVLQFDDLYRCQKSLATISAGIFNSLNAFQGADLTGTAGDDVILGTNAADLIDGLGGDDVICGKGGDDIIFGGAGNDIILGDTGNDEISGGPNDDIIEGEGGINILNGDDGADEISGGNNVDFINGGPGNDTLRGNGGIDQIMGGSGNDDINGNNGDDVLDGGFGNDIIRGGFGRDTIVGGFHDDMLYGGHGEDTISGDEGNDDLYGDKDKDTLLGGPGNDNLIGEQDASGVIVPSDTCDGGTGTDTAEHCLITVNIP
jgi:PKD repeat protein